MQVGGKGKDWGHRIGYPFFLSTVSWQRAYRVISSDSAATSCMLMRIPSLHYSLLSMLIIKIRFPFKILLNQIIKIKIFLYIHIYILLL